MHKAQTLRSEAMKLQAQAKAIFDSTDPSEADLKRFDELCSRRDELVAEAAALEAREDRLNALEAAGNETDARLPHNDARNVGTRHAYSLLKAIRQSDPSNKHERLDGLELEVHQALQADRKKPSKGLLIPHDLEVRGDLAARFRRANPERRDLTTSTGAGAVYETVSTSIIELLRNMMLMRRLGARVLSGLNGTFSIPKQTASGSAYWVTEGNAPTESNQTIGSVDFAPSTVGAFTDYSRAFLSQTAVDAEMFIREDLATVLAIELDRVGFNGSGSGAQPEGIIPNSSVNVVALGTNGAALDWAKLVEMEREIETDNALDGMINFVTTPKARAKMKTTTKVASSTFGDWLWDRDNTANSYPAFSSNQIPSDLTKGSGTALSAAILGNFSQAIYGLWSGIDILVDPYTGGNAGNVRIVELQDADFQIRHPVAFAVIKDYVTT